MDNFCVPRKVNRHVLKAVSNIIKTENIEFAEYSDIVNEVQYSMRNLNPVHRLEEQIKSSLQNMTMLGILSVNKSENSYAVQDSYDFLSSLTKPKNNARVPKQT